MKSVKFLPVTSLESALVGSKDYEFENKKKSRGVELKRTELTRLLQLPPYLCL